MAVATSTMQARTTRKGTNSRTRPGMTSGMAPPLGLGLHLAEPLVLQNPDDAEHLGGQRVGLGDAPASDLDVDLRHLLEQKSIVVQLPLHPVHVEGAVRVADQLLPELSEGLLVVRHAGPRGSESRPGRRGLR